MLLIVVPAAVTFGLAFFDYDLLTSPDFRFLGNFGELIDDPIFRQALRNSLRLHRLRGPAAAAAARSGSRCCCTAASGGAGAHRTSAYLPTVVPDVAYALAVAVHLQPAVRATERAARRRRAHRAGLADDARRARWPRSSSCPCFTIGEGFIVALATRQELPEELYEIATLEGSGPWNTFRRVTLPMMGPTLALLAFRDTAFSLQATFVPALLLTGGGPDRATTFLPLLVYDTAFENLRYGYAAAMTLSMFAITALIVYIQYRIIRRWSFGFGR